MGGMFDTDAEIAAYYQHVDLDASDLQCPFCGCNDATIIKLPKEGSWWSAQDARARCNFCKRVFGLRITDEAGKPIPPNPRGTATGP